MSALSWLLSITLLSSLLIAVQTATWQGLYSDPRHPDKCTINPQLVLNPGVSVKDPTHDCGQIVCGHMSQVTFLGCGINIPPSNCQYGESVNSELPYPDCCRRTLLCN
ncbi:uncharacterized protein [Drosophila kikkawai]|uniref:Uncharacterized protein LOC108077460 n=1 Tax=Drosophila kikkawai TaxID=30033 RepID=A0A6P4IS50_DROKI|nr:uncharacterized protein LOC108077460 [Drosophila kikkawai]XP_017026274.1 uncharacterized protein LOC108077460 [Drosophila kikkawai]XP_041631922.1 uncharacterized protein LOC108077460 [Drosophila kikkawai]